MNDISQAIDRIGQYIKNLSFDAFSDDQKSVDAVARNLEIIGEAANRLPEEFKEKYSEIEWYKVVGCGIGSFMNISALTLRLHGKSFTKTCRN